MKYLEEENYNLMMHSGNLILQNIQIHWEVSTTAQHVSLYYYLS